VREDGRRQGCDDQGAGDVHDDYQAAAVAAVDDDAQAAAE